MIALRVPGLLLALIFQTSAAALLRRGRLVAANRSLFDPALQHLLKPNHGLNSSTPPLFRFSASNSTSVSADEMAKRCHVSNDAVLARRSCMKAGTLNYPLNPCRTVEEPSVAKAYMIYRPVYTSKGPGWDCNVTAIQASHCHKGLSKEGDTECPVTSFDGFNKRVKAESPAYHDNETFIPTGENLKDPWSGMAIPPRNETNCGLLLTLTGTDEPSEAMKVQLQLAELTVCNYLHRFGFLMPNCDSKTVNETVAARNIENSKTTPPRKAPCEIRLHVPIPENETEVQDLSLVMALVAFSEVCKFGGATWWKDRPHYKASPSCEINHGGQPLLARLTYVGKDNFELCPWLQGPGDRDDWIECADRSFCNGDWHGWDCCAEHGGRVRCPKNYRFMCESATCGGRVYSGGLPGDPGQENCCLHSCELHGGWRGCPYTTMVAPLANPPDFESKVARAYNLGFNGVLLSILSLPDVNKMRFMFPSVVRSNFFTTYCVDFECVVNEMVR